MNNIFLIGLMHDTKSHRVVPMMGRMYVPEMPNIRESYAFRLPSHFDASSELIFEQPKLLDCATSGFRALPNVHQ